MTYAPPDKRSPQAATAGPRPQTLTTSQPPMGTRVVSESSFDALMLLPHQMLDVARAVEQLRTAVILANGSRHWANWAISDTAGTQLGSSATAFLLAFTQHSHGAWSELRNIFVGASVAGRIQLWATRHDTFYSDQKGRLIGTARVNATVQSVWFPAHVLVQPDEKLVMYFLDNATVNLDFACEYSALRAE